MRNLLTALVALVVSTLFAGMAAVWLAMYARAQEEFILVFASVAPFGLVVALPMLIASYRPEPRRAVSRVGRFLFGLFALLLAGMFAYLLFVEPRAFPGDVPVLSGLAATAYIGLVAQWLLFHWRATPGTPSPPMRFGRPGAA